MVTLVVHKAQLGAHRREPEAFVDNETQALLLPSLSSLFAGAVVMACCMQKNIGIRFAGCRFWRNMVPRPGNNPQFSQKETRCYLH
jgi:hypothetical protein